MSKLNISKSDWSGEMVDIIINKTKNTVKVHGYLLELNFKVVGEHSLLDVECEGQNLCSGGKVGKDYYLTDGCLSREGSDPYIVAAQMACNLL